MIRTVEDLVEYFEGLGSWDRKNEFVANLKRKSGSSIVIDGVSYKLGKNGKMRIIRSFRRMVCEYNRKQKIDQPVRSLFTGEFIEPGTSNYTKTLRACRIVRYYSTCKEIMSEDETFKNPSSGKMVRRDSDKGRTLLRRCRKNRRLH